MAGGVGRPGEGPAGLLLPFPTPPHAFLEEASTMGGGSSQVITPPHSCCRRCISLWPPRRTYSGTWASSTFPQSRETPEPACQPHCTLASRPCGLQGEDALQAQVLDLPDPPPGAPLCGAQRPTPTSSPGSNEMSTWTKPSSVSWMCCCAPGPHQLWGDGWGRGAPWWCATGTARLRTAPSLWWGACRARGGGWRYPGALS